MAKVAFPARCAVAVVCGEHLVSQVYPASVPVEVFVDNIVELLNDELKRRGLIGLESGVGYELHKANGVRLDVTKTLDELGVEDGATLVLVPAMEGDSFEPQYESLSTGLARMGKKLFEPVTADTAAHTSLAILAMIAASVLGLAIRNRIASDSLIPSIVTGVLGLFAIGGAGAAARWWPHRTDLVGGFAWVAVPLLAVSLGAGAPGNVGAAHLFIAALAAGMLTCGIAVMTQRYVNVAASIVTLVRAGRGGRHGPDVAAGSSPVAGHVHPGHSAVLVDPGAHDRALVRPDPAAVFRVGHRPRPLSAQRRTAGRRGVAGGRGRRGGTEPGYHPTWDTDRGRRGYREQRADRYLRRREPDAAGRGLGHADARSSPQWRRLVLSGLFVLIFISRGRAFADKRQAIALVCGAAAAAASASSNTFCTSPQRRQTRCSGPR